MAAKLYQIYERGFRPLLSYPRFPDLRRSPVTETSSMCTGFTRQGRSDLHPATKLPPLVKPIPNRLFEHRDVYILQGLELDAIARDAGRADFASVGFGEIGLIVNT